MGTTDHTNHPNGSSIYDKIRGAVTNTLGSVLPNTFSKGIAFTLAPVDLGVYVGRAMLHEDVPLKLKAHIAAAGLYTSAGIDIIPEAILGPIGYIDDSIIVISALNGLLNNLDPQLALELWPGDEEVFYQLQVFLGELDLGLHKRIVKPFVRWVRLQVATVAKP